MLRNSIIPNSKCTELKKWNMNDVVNAASKLAGERELWWCRTGQGGTYSGGTQAASEPILHFIMCFEETKIQSLSSFVWFWCISHKAVANLLVCEWQSKTV